jgi:hypothetical protein
MTFLCLPETQIDGTKYQYLNCGCAVITEVLDLSSCGRIRWESHLCRRQTGDTSGGVEGGVLSAAAASYTGQQYLISYRNVQDRKEVIDLSEERNLGIIINCAKTVNTKYRTNGFTGLHWATWAARSAKEKNGLITVRREDPGTTYAGWGRIPRNLLLDAAFAVRENGYWLLVGPKVCNVNVRVRVDKVVLRERPSRDAQVVSRYERGDILRALHTTTGGGWRRPNGRTVARGWWAIEQNGKKVFAMGKDLIQAGG